MSKLTTCTRCNGTGEVYKTNIIADGGHGFEYGYLDRCGYCEGKGKVDEVKKTKLEIRDIDREIGMLRRHIKNLNKDIKHYEREIASMERDKAELEKSIK